MAPGVDETSAIGECRPPEDHRSRPRRRGEVLQEAIYEAALAELSAIGFAELTMDRVAARARASKASLYRRWPSRLELVVDAIRYASPQLPRPADTGELRTDLLAALRLIADSLCGPAGEAALRLFAEVVRDPELRRILRTHLSDTALEPMFEVLRRGIVRGQVRPTAFTPRVAAVGPELVRHQFLTHGAPITDDVLIEIIEEVMLPLLHDPGGLSATALKVPASDPGPPDKHQTDPVLGSPRVQP